MHDVACKTVTANLYSQPDLPTGIIICQINQIWRCSNAFASENYPLALSSEKHLATVFSASSNFENRMGHFKAL